MAKETVPEVKALKALGDETRIRAVLALRDNELCVCQIVELLELAPSTVSKHLQILKEAGLWSLGRRAGGSTTVCLSPMPGEYPVQPST